MNIPDYQLHLRELAPSVVFSVVWSRDDDARWDGDTDWNPEEEGFQPYNTDVHARTIVGGEEIEGWACMGGTWEKPGSMDPEIGGYLPQMLEEAAADLLKKELPLKTQIELRACIVYLKALMRQRWEEQQCHESKKITPAGI